MINQADEDDTLYRVATPSVSKGGKGQDFILLASRRKPCDARCCNMLHNEHIEKTLLMPFHILFLDSYSLMMLSSFVSLRDPYLIALRSVTLPTHPPTEDYTRGEVLCAGFTIWEESSTVTKVGQMRGACSSACTIAMSILLHLNCRTKATYKMQQFTAPHLS